MLFDEKKREYLGPRNHIEGSYDYLDRSARSDSERIRNFLNECLSRFPISDAKELIPRIKSRDRRSFDSAIFEIILYSIMRNLGWSLQVHPPLGSGVNKKPDFLVTSASGEQFYVEAVLASEFSEAEVAAEKRKNVVLQAIDGLKSPNFQLAINAEGNPETPPSGKALRKELSRWLAGLDPDEVNEMSEQEGFSSIPTFEWSHDGWKIEFSAFPFKSDERGKNQRVIAAQFEEVRWINGWKPIKDAIASKGNEYGRLSKPFVVAVNVDGFELDRIDEMQALFGQEQVVIRVGEHSRHSKIEQARNGLWFGPKGPQYTRVSGAWLFGGMTPWNIPSRRNTLYFNPFAKDVIPKELRQLNHAVATEGKMRWIDGMPLWSIMGIDETWPGSA